MMTFVQPQTCSRTFRSDLYKSQIQLIEAFSRP